MTIVSTTYVVSNNQTDGGDLILSGGTLYVDINATTDGTTVNRGGVVEDLDGAVFGTIFVGGLQYLYFWSTTSGGHSIESAGSAFNTTITSGGLEIVQSGTYAFRIVISSGAEDVDAFGQAVSTTVYRGALNLNGGTATGTIVNNTGFVVVNGGTANSTGVSSGGVQVVHTGSTAIGTTVNRGRFVSVDF